MTTRTFGSLANHEIVDFNAGDTLKFGLTYKASKLVLKEDGDGNLVCTYGAKSVTLQSFGLADITPVSFDFADGSLVIAGTAGADTTLQGGGFDDLIFGLAGNDKLQGGDGSDLLDGGAGADTMKGGLGSDSFVLDSMADVVTELADSLVGVDDVDTVTELVNNDTLDANVENMILGTGIVKGTGNASKNTLTGNASDNRLFGLVGADTLLGKTGNDVLDGGVGNDSMNGGSGDDKYVLDRATDAITDSSGDDTAQIVAGDGFNVTSLADGVENLDASMVLAAHSYTLNGLDNTFTGSASNDTVDGGLGSDSLVGGGGDDSLVGGVGGLDGDDTLNGGAGADAMAGGYGSDTYVVNVMGDSVTEAVSAGIDTVRIVGSALLSYSVYGGNVENIDASAAGAGLTLTGNALSNMITGSGGNDSIEAGSLAFHYHDEDTLNGGAGNDTLSGGYGSDTYVIDSASDSIEGELAGYDSDTVRIVGGSITAYDLTSGINGATLMENIDASDSEFAGGLTLTGNSAANIIIGSYGNDTIDATSGGGDNLSGGDGNDTIRSGAATKHYSDTLDGGAGDDTLAGGYGNDTYVVDSDGDYISYGGGSETGDEQLADGDTDTVLITGGAISGYDLASKTGSRIEDLDASASTYSGGTMQLFGTASNNNITGHDGADSIVGNGGNDALYGGGGDDALYTGAGNDFLDGGAGFDYLQGGYGDDVYAVDQNAELTSININEAATGGHDTLRILAANTFNGNVTLLSAMEDLDASESAGGNVLQGNASANHITGSAGGESIFGDTGIDSLEGGGGNDSLYDDFAYGAGFGISGGDGFDILKTADGQDVDFRPIADSIGGVEAIWMLNDQNGNTITLESGDVIAMSDTNTLIIYGGSDDSLSAGAEAGAWNFDSTDGAYNYYSLNGATLQVSVDVQHDLVVT